jgi:hypothetical protein
VGDIVLFSKDIIAMYNDPEAHNRLFTSARGAGLEPAFPSTHLFIEDIFKGAKVTLRAENMEEALILKPATVKDIWLVCNPAGGHVVMSCKILGAPPDDAKVNPLRLINQKCTIAILNGALAEKAAANENQNELPLDEGGPSAGNGHDEDDPEMTQAERDEAEATRAAVGDGDDGDESTIGRQMRAADVKKRRAAKRKEAH